MNWSISKAKMFSKCQRKWFYSEVMASKRSKDIYRYEAYVLKQLGSIHSWRGKLVDYIIEELLVPEFNKKNIPKFNQIEGVVSELMSKQLKFARLKKYRDRKLTKKQAGINFCALREIENSERLENEAIEKIKEQVIISLKNLLKSDLMEILLDSNTILVAQKNLSYKFQGLNVISRPDLIVYFKDKPPMIIDWKVYFYRKDNAWMQLGCYAIALTECISEDPFYKSIDDPTEIKLIEYQLLRNKQKKYQLTDSDVSYIKAYMNNSSNEMLELIKNRKYHELDFNQFETAKNSESCEYCNFKKLCKNKKVKYQVNLMKFVND